MRKGRKKIEATQVEELAFIGSTISEMAIFLSCSEDTLHLRFRKVIERGIVCRTIFLRCRGFDLAMEGNTAALKSFRDTCAGEPSEQSTNPKFHEEQASDAIEKLTQRILKRALQLDALYDKPEMKEMKERLEASYDKSGIKELILAAGHFAAGAPLPFRNIFLKLTDAFPLPPICIYFFNHFLFRS